MKLSEAVQGFNRQTARERRTSAQPPLTEEEVIASIDGWIREQDPVTDDFLAIYRRIAATRTLPPGASFQYHTRWNRPGVEIDVWWIDLEVILAADRGYTYRIRDVKLRSRKAR